MAKAAVNTNVKVKKIEQSRKAIDTLNLEKRGEIVEVEVVLEPITTSTTAVQNMSTSPSTNESPAVAEERPKTLSAETGTNKIRPWKNARTASTANVQKAKTKGPSSGWAARQSERQKEQSIKALEREMKDEKQAAIDQRMATIKERRARLEEKQRLEEAAKRMSAKKLQRMKKRLGRSKKVAQ